MPHQAQVPAGESFSGQAARQPILEPGRNPCEVEGTRPRTTMWYKCPDWPLPTYSLPIPRGRVPCRRYAGHDAEHPVLDESGAVAVSCVESVSDLAARPLLPHWTRSCLTPQRAGVNRRLPPAKTSRTGCQMRGCSVGPGLRSRLADLPEQKSALSWCSGLPAATPSEGRTQDRLPERRGGGPRTGPGEPGGWGSGVPAGRPVPACGASPAC